MVPPSLCPYQPEWESRSFSSSGPEHPQTSDLTTLPQALVTVHKHPPTHSVLATTISHHPPTPLFPEDTKVFQPQGLWICCSLCLECPCYVTTWPVPLLLSSLTDLLLFRETSPLITHLKQEAPPLSVSWPIFNFLLSIYHLTLIFIV